MLSAGTIDSLSPRKPTLFIDRNSGGRLFRSLIEAEGIAVALHDDHFGHTTQDPEWLNAVGARGWIMITGDVAVKRTPLFLLRLSRSAARVFILRGLNGESPIGKAKCVIASYDAIVRICDTHEAPLLWQFNKDGSRNQIKFHSILSG